MTENKQFDLSVKEDSNFFANELNKIKRQVIDVEYPEMPFASGQIVPLSMELPAGTASYEYKIYNKLGLSKIIANPANDLPRVDIEVKRVLGSIYEIGNQFGYTFKDLRAAQVAGRSISNEKIMASKESAMRKFDDVLQYGDSTYNMVGLYNNPNITEYAVSTVGTGSVNTLWLENGVAKKTADQIIADITGILNSITKTSKKTSIANALLLDVEHYTYISSTPRSSNSDTTILKWVQGIFPNVRFLNLNGLSKEELTDNGILGPDGSSALTGSMMVALTINPNALSAEVPMMHTLQKEYQLGLEMIIPTEMEFGGVDIKKPLGFAYGKNI